MAQPSESHPDRYRVAEATENTPGFLPAGDSCYDDPAHVEPWYWDKATCETMNRKRHGLEPEEADKVVASTMRDETLTKGKQTTETEHTTPPWTAREEACSWAIRAESTGNHDILAEVLKTDDKEYDDTVVKANARLIAAAPELLEACISMLEYMPTSNNVPTDTGLGMYARAQAAIAKATMKGKH